MIQFSIIHLYGIVIALALAISFFVAYLRKEKYNLSTNDLENLFLLVVPLGIIGARLYHVLDKWEYYSQNIPQIFAVWNGGLGIYGAVVGGVVGIVVFILISNFKFQISNLLDFIMPSLAVGQAIGRWGNFFNHEVFGPPTNLPWGWFIPQNLRPQMWQNFSYFHPTFLYESMWTLVGFIILSFIPTQGRGKVTGFYCIWYGIGRFFLEFLRFDTAKIGNINVAQVISVGLIFIGALLLNRRR